MTYEKLQAQYSQLHVIEMDLSEVPGLKGLYNDGSIAIKQNMTQKEKSCVLAEEIGHHYTTHGNILDQSDISNRKQEYRARLYGYNIQIGLIGLINAFEHGCANVHEVADFLDVTEKYLLEAVDCYKRKYGTYKNIDNYVIYFEPNLGVMKIG